MSKAFKSNVLKNILAPAGTSAPAAAPQMIGAAPTVQPNIAPMEMMQGMPQQSTSPMLEQSGGLGSMLKPLLMQKSGTNKGNPYIGNPMLAGMMQDEQEGFY